jgi:hypothetical protein
MIKIDIFEREVFMKFNDTHKIEGVAQHKNGSIAYSNSNGEIFTIGLSRQEWKCDVLELLSCTQN